MATIIESLMKPTGRIRPSFELDRVLAAGLALYMQDNELAQASPVLKRAIRAFLPPKYIEEARRELAKRKNGGKRKAARA